MSVLLQAAGGGERLPALGAGVAAGAHVVGADVALQVGGVGEDLVAVLAGEPPELPVHHLVSQEVWSPGESFIAVFTDILVRLVSVTLDHVLVQSTKSRQ